MNTINRTPLSVDKISLTLSVNRDHQDVIIENFHDAQDDRDDFENVAYGELLKNYAYAWKLKLTDSEHCIIQHSPRRSRTNFIRLEYNPAKIGRENVERMFDFLHQCIPNFATSLLCARITRLDLAFDLPLIEVDRILFFDTPRKVTSQVFETNGRMNAYSIGSPESDRFLLIYDKKLEQELRGERIIAQIKTRFELRLRDLHGWNDLQLISNPFRNYSVVEFQNALDMSPNYAWHWLVYASKVVGIQAALSLIENRTIRRRYRDALRALRPPAWWEPDEIWAEVPNALRFAILGSGG